ncbi:hypothetical protein U1Q18_026559 [Sarracenia purpurea var. burkii]
MELGLNPSSPFVSPTAYATHGAVGVVPRSPTLRVASSGYLTPQLGLCSGLLDGNLASRPSPCTIPGDIHLTGTLPPVSHHAGTLAHIPSSLVSTDTHAKPLHCTPIFASFVLHDPTSKPIEQRECKSRPDQGAYRLEEKFTWKTRAKHIFSMDLLCGSRF